MSAEFFNTSVDYLIGNTDISNKIEKVEKFQLNEEVVHKALF